MDTPGKQGAQNPEGDAGAAEAGEPAVFPETAVLTPAQVARALQVSLRSVERMDLPAVHLGHRTVRYVWRQVLQALEKRAA